jgi:integrase
MVKRWCATVGLSGNYGSHTLRKTWGFWQDKRGTPIPLLMEAFGHSTQQQTLGYLCIQAKEVQEIFDLEL